MPGGGEGRPSCSGSTTCCRVWRSLGPGIRSMGQARGAWQGVAPKKEFHQVPAFLVSRQQGLGGRGFSQGGNLRVLFASPGRDTRSFPADRRRVPVKFSCGLGDAKSAGRVVSWQVALWAKPDPCLEVFGDLFGPRVRCPWGLTDRAWGPWRADDFASGGVSCGALLSAFFALAGLGLWGPWWLGFAPLLPEVGSKGEPTSG